MNKEIFWILIRLFPISLYLPIALTLTGLLYTTVLTTAKFWAGHCPMFNDCLTTALFTWLAQPKLWKLFLLLWGACAIVIYWDAYRRIRSQNF